jgi:hypothetical protein
MKGYVHLKVVFPLCFSGQPITLQNELRSITLDVTRSNRATLPSLRTRADSIFPFILPASKNLRRIIVKVLTGEMEQFGSIQLITRMLVSILLGSNSLMELICSLGRILQVRRFSLQEPDSMFRYYKKF